MSGADKHERCLDVSGCKKGAGAAVHVYNNTLGECGTHSSCHGSNEQWALVPAKGDGASKGQVAIVSALSKLCLRVDEQGGSLVTCDAKDPTQARPAHPAIAHAYPGMHTRAVDVLMPGVCFRLVPRSISLSHAGVGGGQRLPTCGQTSRLPPPHHRHDHAAVPHRQRPGEARLPCSTLLLLSVARGVQCHISQIWQSSRPPGAAGASEAGPLAGVCQPKESRDGVLPFFAFWVLHGLRAECFTTTREVPNHWFG